MKQTAAFQSRYLSVFTRNATMFCLVIVQVFAQEETHVMLEENAFIYGQRNKEVKIYVKVFRSSPPLACMTEELANEEIVDPFYLWLGPDGRNIKGLPYVNITETGKLMLNKFEKFMTGPYLCTLSYKRLTDEKETFLNHKFLVYAYREPDYTYQFSIRYSTSDCHANMNNDFFAKLKNILADLIVDLTCQLLEPKFQCHVIKAPGSSLLNELFISFKVNPFGAGWEKVCAEISYDCEDQTNTRVQKARNRIEEFFFKQIEILKSRETHIPIIHYIEGSLEVTRIDSCRPGFGKNEVTHGDCENCCVVCDPGSYSSNNDVSCQTCQSIRISYYGATAC